MSSIVKGALGEGRLALEELLGNEQTLTNIEEAGKLLAKSFLSGNRVFSCGNGGSMCDAMHFAEELSGRFRNDRPPLAAASISDPSHITCTANDYGYEQIFARYVSCHGQKGDVLLAISTSGKSGNVIEAAKAARQRGLSVIGLTGRKDAPLDELADVLICTPAGKYADRVQELHIKVIHILIELVERELFPKNYE